MMKIASKFTIFMQISSKIDLKSFFIRTSFRTRLKDKHRELSSHVAELTETARMATEESLRWEVMCKAANHQINILEKHNAGVFFPVTALKRPDESHIEMEEVDFTKMLWETSAEIASYRPDAFARELAQANAGDVAG